MKIIVLIFSVFLFSVGCNEKNTVPPVVASDTSKVHLNMGLIAYYPFNGNTKDESGNNNDGIVLGGNLTYDEHGYENKAFNFAGNGNKILVNNNGKIAFDTAITVSFHVMRRTAGSHHFIAIADHNTGTGVSFLSAISNLNSNQLSFGVRKKDSPCNVQDVDEIQFPGITDFPVQVESWYNIICVYNKGTLKVFVNGKINSIKSTVNPSTTICPGAQLIIGGWWKGDPSASLNGKMDEVRLYNRELNADEIQELAKKF